MPFFESRTFRTVGTVFWDCATVNYCWICPLTGCMFFFLFFFLLFFLLFFLPFFLFFFYFFILIKSWSPSKH